MCSFVFSLSLTLCVCTHVPVYVCVYVEARVNLGYLLQSLATLFFEKVSLFYLELVGQAS